MKWVRMRSNTSQTLAITVFVCIVFTLNYIYTYLNAPFYYEDDSAKAQDAKFIPYGKQSRTGISQILQQGIYSDYNARWFSDIGSLILGSYLVIIAIPPIEFGALWLFRCC